MSRILLIPLIILVVSRKLLIPLILVAFAAAAISAPKHGQVRVADDGESDGDIHVWHRARSAWVGASEFFEIELQRLDGPTYGTMDEFPPFAKSREWETVIKRLPDGRVCPMVFFHTRWRRLPDVLALDNRLRNFGGCRDVFGDQVSD